MVGSVRWTRHVTGSWNGRWTGARRKDWQKPGATYQEESGIGLPENICNSFIFCIRMAKNDKITSGNNQSCVRERPCTLVKCILQK